jgi:hypothetical protein
MGQISDNIANISIISPSPALTMLTMLSEQEQKHWITIIALPSPIKEYV